MRDDHWTLLLDICTDFTFKVPEEKFAAENFIGILDSLQEDVADHIREFIEARLGIEDDVRASLVKSEGTVKRFQLKAIRPKSDAA